MPVPSAIFSNSTPFHNPERHVPIPCDNASIGQVGSSLVLQGHPGHDPSNIANSQPLGFLLLPQTQWRGEVIYHCVIHLWFPYQSTVMSRQR